MPQSKRREKKSQRGRRSRAPSRARYVTRVKAPAAQGAVYRFAEPGVSSSGRSNKIVVKHRETIRTIAPDAIGVENNPWLVSIPINPGIDDTFPWLSKVAAAYDNYRFISLSFEYEPMCPSSTPGTVMLHPEYDPADPAPNSFLAMTSGVDSVHASMWSPARCELTHLLPRWFFTRNGNVGLIDIHEYDTIALHVGVVGNAVWATPAGALYATYTVEFDRPDTSVDGTGSLVAKGNADLGFQAPNGSALIENIRRACPAVVDQVMNGTIYNLVLKNGVFDVIGSSLMNAVSGCTCTDITPAGCADRRTRITPLPGYTGTMRVRQANQPVQSMWNLLDLAYTDMWAPA